MRNLVIEGLNPTAMSSWTSAKPVWGTVRWCREWCG